MSQPRLFTTSIILALAISSLLAVTESQSSSCTNVLISLSPCLNYISGNSSDPSSSCCKQLTTVVQSQPECLCQVLNGGGSSLGININQTQAMALPSACNVKTPSTSKCSSGSTNTPSTSSGTSGSSSNSVPTTSEGSSGGVAMKSSLSLILSLLFVASYVSVI